MYWDDLMRRWRREHRVLSERLLVGAGGLVATMPTRQRRRHPLLVMILAIVVALGAIALLGSGTHSDVTSSPLHHVESRLVS